MNDVGRSALAGTRSLGEHSLVKMKKVALAFFVSAAAAVVSAQVNVPRPAPPMPGGMTIPGDGSGRVRPGRFDYSLPDPAKPNAWMTDQNAKMLDSIKTLNGEAGMAKFNEVEKKCIADNGGISSNTILFECRNNYLNQAIHALAAGK